MEESATPPENTPPKGGKLRISVVTLPKNYEKAYGASESPEERSFFKIKNCVEADVKWLLDLIANDDMDAARTLIELGVFLADTVERVVTYKPELAQRVAEQRTEWPILITQNPKYPVDPDVLRAFLRLES